MTMKCRKVKAVIRFHMPNKVSDYEKYCRHPLMLYYPWKNWNESKLLGPDDTYSFKLNISFVAEKVKENRSKFEAHSDEMDEALQFVRDNPAFDIFCGNFGAINEQENSDITESINTAEDDLNELTASSLLQEPSTSSDNQATLPLKCHPASYRD